MANSNIPSSVLSHPEIFACPKCNGVLSPGKDSSKIICLGCKQDYLTDNGIPLLFWPNHWEKKEDVTETVQSFYEKNPFPNYEDVDSTSTLIKKANEGVFAKLLNEQLPPNIKILEAGCGTGQLSNFLGIAGGRTIFGADICLNSLRLGQNFKIQNQIERTNFLQMNLFRPVFRAESFHVVISNGVLHHTSDPFLGFQSIAKLVMKGGYIIVGLYNTYGRLATDIRRAIFNISGNQFKFLDSRLRNKNKKVGDVRKLAWFMDQYKHPHESKHTIGEILKWFKLTGFEFINSIPKVQSFTSFNKKEKLFKKNHRGSKLDHLLVQAGMVFTGSKEGGFFTLIGRKKK